MPTKPSPWGLSEWWLSIDPKRQHITKYHNKFRPFTDACLKKRSSFFLLWMQGEKFLNQPSCYRLLSKDAVLLVYFEKQKLVHNYTQFFWFVFTLFNPCILTKLFIYDTKNFTVLYTFFNKVYTNLITKETCMLALATGIIFVIEYILAVLITYKAPLRWRKWPRNM